MSKRRLLVVAAAVAASVAAGITARAMLNTSAPLWKTAAYTIVWQATAYDADGRATPLYTETRYASSSGNWRSVRQYPDGRNEESFAEVGRGVFVKRDGRLSYLSKHSAPPVRHAEGFLRSPDYLRTETILGQQALVVKPGNDPDGRLEIFFAPSLNGEIKTVVRGDVTIIREPLSLTFGEPDASLLSAPRDLPVDYSNYETIHGPRTN